MFHGSMVALVTPMRKDGTIDFECLEQLVEFHIRLGSNAIIAVGTTGESATLTDKEKLQVIGKVVDRVAERIPVIAGTGAVSTKHTAELTIKAMELGADACLLMTPPYVKPTQEGLFLHYKTIADAAAIPQIIYNVPGRTCCDILPSTLERLSHISNIIGIKEATGSLARLSEILDCCEERLDVYSGDDLTAKDFMLHGAKGVISVTANVAPELMRAMYDAAFAGKTSIANEIDTKLRPLHNALFVESNPIPCKWALQYLHLIPSGIRLPLTTLSEQYQPQIIEALATAGLHS